MSIEMIGLHQKCFSKIHLIIRKEKNQRYDFEESYLKWTD